MVGLLPVASAGVLLSGRSADELRSIESRYQAQLVQDKARQIELYGQRYRTVVHGLARAFEIAGGIQTFDEQGYDQRLEKTLQEDPNLIALALWPVHGNPHRAFQNNIIGLEEVDSRVSEVLAHMNRRRPLVRIVLDERLEIPIDSQLVRSANETPVLVIASPAADLDKSRVLIDKGVEVVSNETRNLPILLEQLSQRSLQSVLVEGGAAVAGAFVDARLVNKVSFFIAPKIVGGEDSRSAIGGVGVESMNEALQLDDLEVTRRGDDVEVSGYPRANRE